MFRKALQRVQNIASQAQQSPTRSLAGMGAAMRSGSGLTPMPVASQSGSATGITPPPGGAGLASTPAQQMQGLLQGRPVAMPVASQTQTPSLMSGFGQPIARVGSNPMPPGGGLPAVPQGMKKGGKVSSASKRADGCAIKGKTKGRMV